MTSGNSFVDQATITGESLPVEKQHSIDLAARPPARADLTEVLVSRAGRLLMTEGRHVAMVGDGVKTHRRS